MLGMRKEKCKIVYSSTLMQHLYSLNLSSFSFFPLSPSAMCLLYLCGFPMLGKKHNCCILLIASKSDA